MPAHSKRPSPPARMVQLLLAEKRRMLADGRTLTRRDFEAAWDACWEVMVGERAWPHATEHRRYWRMMMASTKNETRAAFLDQPTPFSTLAASLTAAARRFRIDLSPEELPMVFIRAIQAGYSVSDEDVPREEIAA